MLVMKRQPRVVQLLDFLRGLKTSLRVNDEGVRE